MFSAFVLAVVLAAIHSFGLAYRNNRRLDFAVVLFKDSLVIDWPWRGVPPRLNGQRGIEKGGVNIPATGKGTFRETEGEE